MYLCDSIKKGVRIRNIVNFKHQEQDAVQNGPWEGDQFLRICSRQ